MLTETKKYSGTYIYEIIDDSEVATYKSYEIDLSKGIKERKDFNAIMKEVDLSNMYVKLSN